MNAAKTDYRLMTHSDQTCPPQWVRQWFCQALAQLKELANLPEEQNGCCGCRRLWGGGGCQLQSDQDRAQVAGPNPLAQWIRTKMATENVLE